MLKLPEILCPSPLDSYSGVWDLGLYRNRILHYASTLLFKNFSFMTHLDFNLPWLFRWNFFAWQVDKLRSTKSKFVDNYISGGPTKLCCPGQAGPNPASNDQLGCPAVSPEEFLMSLNLMISQKNSTFHWEYSHYIAFKVLAIHQEGLGNIELAKLCITLFQFESILMCLLGLQCIVGHGSNSASPWLQLGD